MRTDVKNDIEMLRSSCKSIGMIRKIEFAVENEKESKLSSCVLMELNFILCACASGHSMG